MDGAPCRATIRATIARPRSSALASGPASAGRTPWTWWTCCRVTPVTITDAPMGRSRGPFTRPGQSDGVNPDLTLAVAHLQHGAAGLGDPVFPKYRLPAGGLGPRTGATSGRSRCPLPRADRFHAHGLLSL